MLPSYAYQVREQRERLSSIEDQITSTTAKVKALKDALGKLAADEGSTDAEPAQAESIEEGKTAESRLKSTEDELQTLNTAKNELESVIPVSLVMKERKDVRPTHILIRGAYDQPGERVQRDTPAFLPSMTSEGDVKTRMDLARWLTDNEHPLTARVTVNRFWQQFFGVGLVRTSEDFGTQGEWPSHPRLLDDLTTEFCEFWLGR